MPGESGLATSRSFSVSERLRGRSSGVSGDGICMTHIILMAPASFCYVNPHKLRCTDLYWIADSQPRYLR